jgi:polyisoprenoid-binding protein YceI
MKKLSILLLSMVLFVRGNAQKLQPIDEGSSVKFSIKNFGFSTGGNFKGLKGVIQFDATNLSSCSFAVTVDAGSVNTGNNTRDNHLRKEEYFDVAKYPVIDFTSVSVNKDAGSAAFILTGNLTIKGVTKKISFPFTAAPQNNGYLFSGSFTINRRDFGVGGNSMVLADNLQVQLNVFAKSN